MEFSENTLKGLGLGFSIGLLCRKKFSFASMGGGIGGGIAFNKCADDFNRIHAREIRVARSLKQEGKDDF